MEVEGLASACGEQQEEAQRASGNQGRAVGESEEAVGEVVVDIEHALNHSQSLSLLF